MKKSSKELWPKPEKLRGSVLDILDTDCLDNGQIPTWMTKGRTVLLQKDKAKGNDSSNCRPITCLPLAWKILTGILAEEIYSFFDENMILPEEQKGCR